ncbi:MAG: anti-sigma-factor antagonist [Acidimicrobiales bacterium]|nr:anti-sigma-factor antagonist [Acidimicrobiales bacterium]
MDDVGEAEAEAEGEGEGEGEGEAIAAVEVSRDDDGALIISLSGEIDVSTIDILTLDMAAALDDAPDGVVFELSEVTFFDSSGLTLLLTAQAKVGVLRLRTPSDIVRRVVEVSGLSEVLETER